MALPAAAPLSLPMHGSAPQEFSIDCVRNACSHAYSSLNGNLITKKKLVKLVGKEMGIKGKISKEHNKLIRKQMKFVLKGKLLYLLNSKDLNALRNACSHVFSRLDGNLTTEKKLIKLVGKEVGVKGKISKQNKKLIRKQMKYVLKKKPSCLHDSKDLKDDNSYIGGEASSSGEVKRILTNEKKHKRKRKHISKEEKPVRELRKSKKGMMSQEMRSNETKIRRKSVSFVDVCEGESFRGCVSVSCGAATEHSSQKVEESDLTGIISADSEKNECSISLDSNMTKTTAIEPLTDRSESHRSGRRRSMRLLRSREKLLHVRSDSSQEKEVDASKQRIDSETIRSISAKSEKYECNISLDSNMAEATSIEPLSNRCEFYRSGRRRSVRCLRSREKLLHARSDSSSTNEDDTKRNISARKKKNGLSSVSDSNVIESADVEPLVHPRWRKSFEKLKELQLNVSYSCVFLGKLLQLIITIFFVYKNKPCVDRLVYNWCALQRKYYREFLDRKKARI